MAWTYNTADDVPSDGAFITVIAVAFTAASLLAVGLRFYVRAILVKSFGPDDWVLLVTWFASLGFAMVSTIQTKWGLGLVDPTTMPVENLYNFGLLQYMGAPFYISSILGFKLSLLLSYLRFFPPGPYKILNITVAVACVMFHISFLVVQINLCTPIAKQWDPAVKGGHCVSAVPFYTTMASLTILFDLLIMFLPFPVLYQSKIQRRKKVVLLGLFALGLFITVIQIVRIQTIKQLEKGTVDSAKLIMWSMVENNLGIIVTCIPTFAPLIKYFHEKSRRGTSTSGAGGTRTRTRKSGYGLPAWRQSRLNKFLPHHHAQAAQPLGSVVDGREFDVSGPPSRQDGRPPSRYSLTAAHKGIGIGGGGGGGGRPSMSRHRSSSEDNDDDHHDNDKAAGPGILCQTEIHIETEAARPPPLTLSPAALSSSLPATPSPLGGGRRSPSMIAPRSPALPHHMGAGGCPLPSPRAASMIAPRSPAAVSFAAESRAP